MIDIERLKVDPAYWDEVAPEGAAYYMPETNDVYATWVLADLDGWADARHRHIIGERSWHQAAAYTDDEKSLIIPRPQPSPASLLTDEQAEALMGEPIVIERANIQQANIDGGLVFNGAVFGESTHGKQGTDWDAIIKAADEAIDRATIKKPKYPHYFKDVSGVDAIDLYHVAKLYEINDPALFHALKKIACAGKRGAKDQAQDVQEAIDALKRWQELNK